MPILDMSRAIVTGVSYELDNVLYLGISKQYIGMHMHKCTSKYFE